MYKTHQEKNASDIINRQFQDWFQIQQIEAAYYKVPPNPQLTMVSGRP